MILVDSALARHRAEGKPPIRVGMIGAGFMASGVLLQINSVHRDTMRVVAIANRTPAKSYVPSSPACFAVPAERADSVAISRGISVLTVSQTSS